MDQRLQQPARLFSFGQLRGQLVDAADVARPAGADDLVTPVQCLHMPPQIEKRLLRNLIDAFNNKLETMLYFPNCNISCNLNAYHLDF